MSKEHGFLVIDKPAGMTSHDVVAQVRKRLGTKQVGHAGTLDPMATGVLVVGINNATKFLQYIVTGRKRYNAVIRLGISTVTDDKEGDVIAERDWRAVTDSDIENAIDKFRGTFMQVPSSVSAKKIAGERAYDLVREGKEVELAANEVTIHELKILAIRRGEHLDIDVDVTCSAGTYIRAIARDLGTALGVGGHLIELRRTEVAPFNLAQAGEIASAQVLPLADAITKVLPKRELGFDEVVELRFGRRIDKSDVDGSVVGIAPDGEVAAILENREGRAQPVSVFTS
ncbi:MAG: tRNA pseudouridine(55) synthase TruB [Actinobacteria bacterium]|nr:tRNA pseudouridine(55) synthase TruB [Actinomycetota bacterium]